jgi:hypothetical protein
LSRVFVAHTTTGIEIQAYRLLLKFVVQREPQLSGKLERSHKIDEDDFCRRES